MKKENLIIWEEIFKSNEWGKYPPLALVKFIARNYYSSKNRKDVKFLEIGSGPGANLWFMAKEGFTVYGIDGSKTACVNARKRLENEKLEKNIGEIISGDYFNKLNTLNNNYFDAIVDVESLYCNSFEKSKEILELAISKLKPKGKLFSLTFGDGTWGTDIEQVGHHLVRPIEGPMANTGTARFTTKEDIEKLYKFPNTEIVKIERQELHLENDKVIKEWIIEIEKQ
jgi:cyclopropane fatty-acyl-phospholipid synthase-like methyltransferase